MILARAGRRLGGGDESSDSRVLEADIGLVLSEGINTGSFDPQAMSLMLDIMVRHGLEVPGPMTVLSRALLTLEGTLRTIEPTFNIAREVTACCPRSPTRSTTPWKAATPEGAPARDAVAADAAWPHRSHRDPAAQRALHT